MPQMGVSVSEGTITKWLKQPARRSPRTSRCSRSRPTRSTRRCRALATASSPRSSSQRARPSRWEPCCRDRAGRELPPSRCCSPQPSSRRGPVRPSRPPSSAPAAASGSDRPGRGRPEHRERSHVRIAGRRTDRRRAGVDPSVVPGTGTGGRVTKKDILAYIEAGRQRRRAPPRSRRARAGRSAPAAAAPAAPRSRPLPLRCASEPAPPAPAQDVPMAAGETEEPMTAMRRGVMAHMRKSLDTSAHVTSAIEVDMSRVVAAREALKAEYQARTASTRPTSRSSRRATIETLVDWPWINGEIRGESIVTRSFVNLGIAVALDDGMGLIVPVIRNAQDMNLLGIARAIADLADARAHEEAAARRRPGRHLHDHEPGRLRHLPRHADHQPTAGRDPRHLRARQAPVGRPGRPRPGRDRDPAAHEHHPHLRPSTRRRRLQRRLPAATCASGCESWEETLVGPVA